MIRYDPEQHILLRDQAHKRRIHADEEFAEYLRRVRECAYWPGRPDARIEIFDVEVPEWPPVYRTPLQMMFSIGRDGRPSGPFADMPWIGVHPAVDRDVLIDNATFRIAKDMVPDTFVPERLNYQWQVHVFDPAEHVVIRYWCKENGVDIVRFWNKFYPRYKGQLEIVETTNPTIREERAVGSYSPTRRCVRRADLPLLEAGLLEGRESALPPPPAPDPVRVLAQELRIDRFEASPSEVEAGQEVVATWSAIGQVKARVIRTSSEVEFGDILPSGANSFRYRPEGAHTVHLRVWGATGESVDSEPVEIGVRPAAEPEAAAEPERPHVTDGAAIYSPLDVHTALRDALGRPFNLFGGQFSDTKIVALSRDRLSGFLASDPTNRDTYVADRGGRNFDCDNFADRLRNGLASQGLNSCGVIWGDRHAFNFFVTTGTDGPEIVFVEPQTDALVERLEAEYSIRSRCSVYL